MSYETSKSTETKPMSGAEFGAAMVTMFGIVGVLGFQKNKKAIEYWIFQNYEEICFSLYLILALVIWFLVRFIQKKTKAQNERACLLSQIWDDDYQSIKAGSTRDAVDLHVSDKSRTSHVQVIGTTGSGKTTSVVIPWCLKDLLRGRSSLVIDGKGSRDLPEELKEWTELDKMNVNLFHFNLDDPEKSHIINPLKNGSPQQITDRIFSSFDFEDPFYRSVQFDICGYLTRLIHAVNDDVSFKLLYELLTDDEKLASYLSECEDKELKSKLTSYLKEPVKDRRAKMAGLISQLSPFATSEISGIVNGGANETNLGDMFLEHLRRPTLFIYSIPTLKYQKLGSQLGKIILQELAWIIGTRESKNENFEFASVFLDEFSEFVYEGFISILNKARSANVGLHLCHQALSDLTKVSESFARGVNTNTNVKCVLGVNDPETADFYARHFGTKSEEKLTEQIGEKSLFGERSETGRGSKRITESYKIHPNTLKNFYHGTGVLHLPTKLGTITEAIQFDPYESRFRGESC